MAKLTFQIFTGKFSNYLSNYLFICFFIYFYLRIFGIMEIQYKKPYAQHVQVEAEAVTTTEAVPHQNSRVAELATIIATAQLPATWQPNWSATHRKVAKAGTRALKTPDELWVVACGYFDYTQKTPHIRKEYVKTGPLAGTSFDIETPRPFTWHGLSVYASLIGVAASITRYARNDNDAFADFAGVVEMINSVMFSQKFEGAAIGVYKENIIAREIGLADKTAVAVSNDQPLFNIE